MPCLIMSKSLTTAKRSERVLLQNGIPARVIRPSQDLTDRGCGYAVRFEKLFLKKAVMLLEEYKLPVRRIYERTASGHYQEITP